MTSLAMEIIFILDTSTPRKAGKKNTKDRLSTNAYHINTWRKEKDLEDECRKYECRKDECRQKCY